MADSQNRNLPASGRKISKARADGQVARSRDLGHLAALGVGTLMLISLSPLLVDTLKRLLATGLRFDAQSLQPADAMMQQLMHQGLQMLLLVLPMGGAVLVAALAAGLLSGGWNFTLKPLMPKFSKLNPITGLPRLLQPTQLVETLKSLPAGQRAAGHRVAVPATPLGRLHPARCAASAHRAGQRRRAAARRADPVAAGAGGLRAGRRAAAALAPDAAAEDDPGRGQAGVQGGRGQRRDEGQDQGAHAPAGQQAHAGRGARAPTWW
jgi:hypothetical protein